MIDKCVCFIFFSYFHKERSTRFNYVNKTKYEKCHSEFSQKYN